MKSTSIKSRLVNGLMLIVLFFLVQAGMVWYATGNAKSTVVENTRKNTVATSELGSLAVFAQQIRRYEKEYFIYIGNKEKRDSYEQEWRGTLGKIEATLARMKTGSDGAFSPKDIEQVVVWSDASAFYAAEMQKIFHAVAERSVTIEADKSSAVASPSAPQSLKTAVVTPPEHAAPVDYRPIEVNDMIKAGKDRFSADLMKGVATMDSAKTGTTLALADVAEKMFDQVLTGVLITVAIGVLVALLLSFSLPRTVTRTIGGLSNAAETMSMGNLEQAYDSGGVTEFDKLAEALNRMRLGQQALVERLQRRQ